MTLPTIGVYIPVYWKHVQYMPRLMASIANQTKQPDEIIILFHVDQKTAAEKHSKWYGNAKIIYNDTPFIASIGRNILINHATCDIISFMDADDIMHNKRIEYIYQTMTNGKCDGVLHCYNMNRKYDGVNDWDAGELDNDHIIEINPNQRLPNKVISLATDGSLMINAAGPATYKRECFDNIRYPENMVRGEDSQLCIDMIKAGYHIGYIHNVIYSILK